jgi:hypothetical protein
VTCLGTCFPWRGRLSGRSRSSSRGSRSLAHARAVVVSENRRMAAEVAATG